MDVQLSYSTRIFWALVLLSEAVIIIFSNIVALRIFLKRKFLVCKSSFLLVSLTAADVLVGFSPLIISMEVLYSSQHMYVFCSKSLNDMSLNYSLFTLLTSLTSMTVIASERALATLMPVSHHSAKRKYYIYGISWSWLTASLLPLHRFIAGCANGNISNQIVRQSLIISLVIPPIVVIVASYVAVLIKMRFFPLFRSTMTTQKHAKLSRTLIMTTLVAVITWIPQASVMITRAKCESCREAISLNVVIAADLLLYSNSFFNLLVYYSRMPAFRKEVKMILRKFQNSVTNEVNPIGALVA